MSGYAYAYPRDGALAAVVDGPELLVYNGVDQPLWKVFSEGILVGVAVSKTHVVSLDSDGRLQCRNLRDGGVEQEVHLGPNGVALDISSDGLVAVAVDGGVSLVDGETVIKRLDIADAVVVAFGPDRKTLAVGTRQGEFRVLDPFFTAKAPDPDEPPVENAVPEKPFGGTATLPGPITGIAWSSRSEWAVTCLDKLVRMGADAAQIIATIEAGDTTSHPHVSTEGALIVCRVGTDQVGIFEIQNNAPCGTITLQRAIHGLAFGPNTWLGIGLEDGEMTRVDYVQKTITRSEPHAGRARTMWRVEQDLQPAAIRGAMAWVRSGGAPIASRVVREDNDFLPASADGSGPNWMLIGCVVFLLIALCSGCCICSGVGGSYYYGYI